MIVDAVTARYAGALYNLAHRKGALTDVARDTQALSEALATGASRRMVENPRLDREAKRRELKKLTTGCHALTRNFVEMVIDKRREAVLLGVGDAVKKRMLDERGAVEGVVESARAVSDAELARLGATLGKRLKKELILANRIVPELVGGARVIAANRMIDYSVQGRLEALRRRMMDARLGSASRA